MYRMLSACGLNESNEIRLCRVTTANRMILLHSDQQLQGEIASGLRR
ncbi:hypothetical protein [Paenibacillus shirakamiensis]|nr:hypothetical protein [Paenibacillus shirakamiensis]